MMVLEGQCEIHEGNSGPKRMEKNFMQEIHHMTMCWHGACCDLVFYFLAEFQCQRRILVIRWLTPEIPRKEQNKLCYSLRLNELCKCMWQVNIGGLWRRYPQPPHSAEPRRPEPNEDWTLIIRRIWLPHETNTHTRMHTRLNTPPPATSLSHTHTQCTRAHTYAHTQVCTRTHTEPHIRAHAHAYSLTSLGFRCHPVLCR